MSEPTEFFAGTRDLPGDAPQRSDPPEPRSGTAAATTQAPATQTPGDGARPPGRGLSGMLLPELQRLAQSMGITGVGRMRKSQLIEAIQSRQSGTAAGPARSATASAALDHSATRRAPAGADAPRHREQEAMEPDRPTQPAPGERGQAVTSGQGTRGGSAPGASGAPGQLTFAPAAETVRAPVPAGEPSGGGAREATGDSQAAGDVQPAGDGPRESRASPPRWASSRRTWLLRRRRSRGPSPAGWPSPAAWPSPVASRAPADGTSPAGAGARPVSAAGANVNWPGASLAPGAEPPRVPWPDVTAWLRSPEAG